MFELLKWLMCSQPEEQKVPEYFVIAERLARKYNIQYKLGTSEYCYGTMSEYDYEGWIWSPCELFYNVDGKTKYILEISSQGQCSIVYPSGRIQYLNSPHTPTELFETFLEEVFLKYFKMVEEESPKEIKYSNNNMVGWMFN